jgi:hypothetical protein
MKTIQITIEDSLLEELDKFLDGQSRARSSFIRDSIAKTLRKKKYDRLVELDVEGYRRQPQTEDELLTPGSDGWPEEDFSSWETK